MQWISRDFNESTDVHFFTSHFHSTLASDGVEGVESWTVQKNINIFEKKLIFIPIVKTLHWSLCVIVNPGAVEKSNLIFSENDKEDTVLSCMLFFASLKMHNKVISQRLLIKWLNSEWQRVNDTFSTPFTTKNYRIYDPEGVFKLLRIVLGLHGSLSPYINFFIEPVVFSIESQSQGKEMAMIAVSSSAVTLWPCLNFVAGDSQKKKLVLKKDVVVVCHAARIQEGMTLF
jgi:hypothetical protein